MGRSSGRIVALHSERQGSRPGEVIFFKKFLTDEIENVTCDEMSCQNVTCVTPDMWHDETCALPVTYVSCDHV